MSFVRLPSLSGLLHHAPDIPSLPSWRLPAYGPFPGASSHGIMLGLGNLGHAFSPHGLYQGFGPRGAGGELLSPFVGAGGRMAQGRAPSLAQVASVASLFPGRTGAGARAGLISPYNTTQAAPRPTPPQPPSLTAQQRLALRFFQANPQAFRQFWLNSRFR